MAVLFSIPPLAIALFVLSASADKIQLTGLAFSNTTSSPTTLSSHSITSPPMTRITSVLNWCQMDDDPWVDCANGASGWQVGEDSFATEFAPSMYPYNTTLFPENIVPANASIASYCGSLWSSSAAAFWAGNTLSYFRDDVNHTAPQYESTFSWHPTATPCCLNCTMLGGSITVNVWPKSAPYATLIDLTANYTFVSPSVYVVFDKIAATDRCGQVGKVFTNATIAFNPTELSTQRSFYAILSTITAGPFSGLTEDPRHAGPYIDPCSENTPDPNQWSTFDYAAAIAHSCPALSAPAPFSDEYRGAGSLECAYNPCSPYVSVPTQIYSLDTRFNLCMDGIKAFLDPPSTLAKGGNLVPFSTTPVSSSTAKPAASPQPAVASQTPKPIPIVPISNPSSSPDPVDRPSGPSPSALAIADPGNPETPSDPGTDPQVHVDPNTKAQGAPAVNTQISDNPSPATHVDPETAPQSPVDPSPTTQADPGPSATPIATIGSLTVYHVSSHVVIGVPDTSYTLAPGGKDVTMGGTIFSLNPSTSLIVDGSETTLALPTTPAPFGILTTSNGKTGLVIGSQTVIAGAPAITVAGTTISLVASGGAVVVNGVTASLHPSITPAPSLTTIPGSTFLVVASQTLVAGGPAITISGTALSLQSGGESVVVGSSTQDISSFFAGSTTTGLGGAILVIGGFTTNSEGATSTGFNGAVFTGAASRINVVRTGLGWAALSLAAWRFLL